MNELTTYKISLLKHLFPSNMNLYWSLSGRFSKIVRQYKANQFQSEIANPEKYLGFHAVDKSDAEEVLWSYATPLTNEDLVQ